MIFLLTFIFYFLDTLINNILMINSFSFFSSYLVFTLLVIVFFFIKEKKNYFIYSLIISVLFSYNISVLLINMISFSFISIFIINYFKTRKYNLLNILFVSITSFIIYTFFLGIMLNINYYENIEIYYVFLPFYRSLFINSLILITSYFIFIKRKTNHTI